VDFNGYRRYMDKKENGPMKRISFFALLWSSGLMGSALAAATLDVKIQGIEQDKPIPTKYAYCMPDGKGKTKDGGNISPAISWSGAPEGTKSYAIIVVDPDVPAKFDTANKDGEVITENFPRQNFYHWVLVDIPVRVQGLLAGKDSNGVTPGGKLTGQLDYGLSGINGYGFGGYDGPCPPWNDQRLHHYKFTVYALDVASLKLPDPVRGILAEKAMEGHVLAKGEVVGTYTNNPAVMGAK
jgi:Raf kinase inhibitor-like YbhB/YbcL family protein